VNSKKELGKVSKRAKQKQFLEQYPKLRFNISLTCKQLKMSRQIYYKWRDTDPVFARELHNLVEMRGDFIEEALLNLISQNDTIATIFACKTLLKGRGYVEGNRESATQTDPITVELLTSLISGEIDLKRAALEFAKAGLPLPEGVKILLQKEIVSDIDEAANHIPSDEELEALYQRNLAASEAQRGQFLTDRRADVNALKLEMATKDLGSGE
jgi:hypothetical protein